MPDFISVVLIPLLVAFVSSSGVAGVVLYFLKRKDGFYNVKKVTDRQAEGIAVIIEGFVLLLEALHKKGVVNGESEHIRRDLEEYLLKCTRAGLYTKKSE